MASTLDRATEQLAQAATLLEGLTDDLRAGARLLALLGWDLPPGVADIGLSRIDVTTVVARLRDLNEIRSTAAASDLDVAAAVSEVAIALADTFDHLHAMGGGFSATPEYLAATNIVEEFFPRLADLLVIQMVGSSAPTAAPVGVLLGLFDFTLQPADSAIFQVEHVRQVVRWDRIAQLFTEPGGVFRDVYGWGTTDFDANTLIANIAAVLDHLAVASRLRRLPRRVEEQLTDRPVPEADTDPAVQLFVSLARGLGFDPLDVGVSLYPVRPDIPGGTDGGIGLSPYAMGTTEARFRLSERLSLLLESSLDLEGGVALLLRAGRDAQLKSGLVHPVSGGVGGPVTFDLSLRHEAETGGRLILLSLPGIQLDAAALSVGAGKGIGGGAGTAVNPAVVASIADGRLTVVPDSGDGFLATVLPVDSGVTAQFRLVVSWSARDGVQFEGGAGLRASISLHSTVGPLRLDTLNLALEPLTDSIALAASLTGAVTFGPCVAAVDGVGTAAELRFERGNLGPCDLGFRFMPPTSIGLSVNAEGITGGGFLCIDPPNYVGAMELSFQNEIDLAAFGLITTRLPDGKPGFSLVIQILAEFQPIQLGLGFALTGVGGLIGINRHINETNLRDAIKNHTFDLFPQNPITDAVRLIGTIESVLPAKEGFHVFGPMAKIFWGGSVKLVEFEVGIFIEIGGPLRIALIGRAWSILPSEETQLLVLNVDVFGIIDFGDERIALDAFLFDSNILRFPLDGQMALRADWSEGEENFALSVGGFHPRFQAIPPGFPTLRRLMVSVGSGNPRLTLSMYLAITTNTLQVGAQLDLWAKKAGFTITGGAGFDALIIFSPFSFLVILNIWVNVKKSFIDLGVWLELELNGPNPLIAVGFAKFKVGFFTKRVRFRKEFGDRIDEPLPVVSPLAVLKAELENPRGIRFKLPDWASANLIFTQEAESRIDPVAEIIIDQDAVPLDLTMDRFGGGTPPPAEKKLNITAGLGVDEEHPTTSLFAPNQFKNWSEEQRLSAKPFEKFKSGIRMGGDWVIPEDDLEERCIGFETVVRESKEYRAGFSVHAIEAALDRFTCVWQPQEASLLDNWSMFGSGNYFRPLRKTADTLNPNYVRVVDPTFTLVVDETENGQSRRLDVDGRVAGDMTFTEALDLAEQFTGSNVNVRNVVDVESMAL